MNRRALAAAIGLLLSAGTASALSRPDRPVVVKKPGKWVCSEEVREITPGVRTACRRVEDTK